MILLDTNVISELVRPVPQPAVQNFLRSHPPEELFTSAICEAEIRYGVARIPAGRRRDELAARILAFLAEAFAGGILPFDSGCAARFAEIRASREAKGKPIAVEDAMIAATTAAHGATLATRNLADFGDCGIEVVNPWQP